MAAGQPVTIEGQGGPIPALPILQDHGDITSLGFRFGSLAYSCDLSGLPADSVAALRAASTSGSSTRCATRRIRATSASSRRWPGSSASSRSRAILTNLHTDLDYEELRGRLPPHVEPAYDGLQIELTDPRR